MTGTLLLGVGIGIFATLTALIVVVGGLWGLWTIFCRCGWIHHSTYTMQTFSGPVPPHQEERL